VLIPRMMFEFLYCSNTSKFVAYIFKKNYFTSGRLVLGLNSQWNNYITDSSCAIRQPFHNINAYSFICKSESCAQLFIQPLLQSQYTTGTIFHIPLVVYENTTYIINLTFHFQLIKLCCILYIANHISSTNVWLSEFLSQELNLGTPALSFMYKTQPHQSGSLLDQLS